MHRVHNVLHIEMSKCFKRSVHNQFKRACVHGKTKDMQKMPNKSKLMHAVCVTEVIRRGLSMLQLITTT